MKQNKLSSVSKRQFSRVNKSNKISYCTYLLYLISIFSILLLIGTILSDDIFLTLSSRFTKIVGYSNNNNNNNKLSRDTFKQKEKGKEIVDIIIDKPLYEVNKIKYEDLIIQANKYNEEYEENKRKQKEEGKIREAKRLKRIQDKKDLKAKLSSEILIETPKDENKPIKFETLVEEKIQSPNTDTNKARNKPDYKGIHPSLIPVVEPARCGETLTDSGNIPEEKRICVLPHKQKEGIKLDLRIKLDNINTNFTIVNRPYYDQSLPISNKVGYPRSYLLAKSILSNHPLHFFKPSISSTNMLEETMVYLYNLPVCENKPIFLTMATVHDELYWQLIENFVYSMVKFNTSDCSLVICVSDPNCMKLCNDFNFPCYNFQTEMSHKPHVMEQIAELKLHHIPSALLKGVDVFMLDLDVGFLDDPMHMVNAFYETPKIDIFVQEDLLFIMNRSLAGWKTWFTEPLPNIGLFLCRGNNKTEKVFQIAWDKYLKMPNPNDKQNPGKDQNHVLEGMRIGRATFGLRYAYFSNNTAVLLDKMNQFVSRTVELGGIQSATLLTSQKSLAMHTTCYEQTTKVMGLKATNSFWNPLYYDPLRPTITKQILYISDNQVLDEVRSLMWLAMVTNRALITPNILGSEEIETVTKYNGHALWPGFRVSKLKRSKGRNIIPVNVLEPAFYWRVNRDYDEPPKPTILYFNPKTQSLLDIKNEIDKLGNTTTRLVVHGLSTRRNKKFTDIPIDLQEKINDNVNRWAQDSVGYFSQPYSKELINYGVTPSVKQVDRSQPMVNDVLNGVRNCLRIFGSLRGNRTCFQICD